MNTASEAQSLLDRVTYKKGWYFEAYPDAFTGNTVVSIHTTIKNPDHWGDNRTIRVSSREVMWHWNNDKEFYWWLRYMIEHLELEIARKWLRVDGVMLSPDGSKQIESTPN